MPRRPDHDVPPDPALARLARRISGCRRCPRLVKYLGDARARWPDHRCKPVPGWGDVKARLIIVGLADAAVREGKERVRSAIRAATGESPGSERIVVNLSGRGDKDTQTVARARGLNIGA